MAGTQRNPDSSYKKLSQMMRFSWDQFAKEIHTGLPGIIVSYDSGTRRAQIQPAIDLLMVDGERLKRPVLNDVPVLVTALGGYMIHVHAQKGDVVWLAFSQRGLTEFKKTLQQAAPDEDSVLSIKDAVAFSMGFGSFDAIPASEGLTIQTNDAETYIELHSDYVDVVVGDTTARIARDQIDADVAGGASVTASGDVEIEAPKVRFIGEFEVTGKATFGGEIEINGTSVNHAGRNIGATHTHSGVSPGAGVSGPPAT